MKRITSVTVKYHNQEVGKLSMTPDNTQCVFQYNRKWTAEGFSISPIQLPLNSKLYIAPKHHSMVISEFLSTLSPDEVEQLSCMFQNTKGTNRTIIRVANICNLLIKYICCMIFTIKLQ